MKKLSPLLVRRLAIEAGVCDRSAAKALDRGAGAVRGIAGARIAEAAARLGVPLPDADATARSDGATV